MVRSPFASPCLNTMMNFLASQPPSQSSYPGPLRRRRELSPQIPISAILPVLLASGWLWRMMERMWCCPSQARSRRWLWPPAPGALSVEILRRCSDTSTKIWAESQKWADSYFELDIGPLWADLDITKLTVRKLRILWRQIYCEWVVG